MERPAAISDGPESADSQATADAFALCGATVADLGWALAAGRTTSVEITALYLNRIARYDHNGPRLNAVPLINPSALDEAAARDAERRAGHVRSPLHGIPYTIKDSYAVEGMTIAAGSPAFADLAARRDAFAVERLRAAGAVLIGKTTMPPLANGGMQRGLYGRAENPFNPDYLSAAWESGSSNGSAVSLAAELAAFSMGEETVSSGRSPASCNGIVAYTPSRGLISIRGNWPLFPTHDVVVPYAKSVDDLLMLLDELMVEDTEAAGDLWRSQRSVALPSPTDIRPQSFASLPHVTSLRGVRLGVPRLYTGTDAERTTPMNLRPSIADRWQEAARVLRELGAELVDIDLPIVENDTRDRPGAQSACDRGLLPPGWDHVEQHELVAAAWEEFLESVGDDRYPTWTQVDPSRVYPAPFWSSPQPDEWGTGYYREIIELVRQGATRALDTPNLDAALRGLEEVRALDFESHLDGLGLDAVVMPAVCEIGPADADINAASNAIARSAGASVATMDQAMRRFGIPSVSVSMGTMSDTGVPVNLTIAGRAYDDVRLLGFARAYEQATRHRRPAARTAPLEDETLSADRALPAGPVSTLLVTVTVDDPGRASAIAWIDVETDAAAEAVKVWVNGERLELGEGTRPSALRAGVHLSRYTTGGPLCTRELTFITLAATAEATLANRTVLTIP